jgi:hypothetical protein
MIVELGLRLYHPFLLHQICCLLDQNYLGSLLSMEDALIFVGLMMLVLTATSISWYHVLEIVHVISMAGTHTHLSAQSQRIPNGEPWQMEELAAAAA